MIINRGQLKKAARLNPQSIFRLAKNLRLRIVGMSARQVASLIYWRITRADMIGEERWRR